MKFGKIILLALVGALLCSAVACDLGLKNKDYVATSDEYFDFELSGEVYAISAKSGVELPAQINLPATYDGKAVVAVASEGFTGKDITQVVIPESYTEIRRDAFSNCAKLKTVQTSAVKTIGNRAFCDCAQLSDFSFPAALTAIGDFAFSGTRLTSAKFNAVKTIGNFAFYGCGYLKTVYIPKTTTKIGDKAFEGINAEVKFDVANENANYKVDGGKIVKK